jgi:hypothetical protein
MTQLDWLAARVPCLLSSWLNVCMCEGTAYLLAVVFVLLLVVRQSPQALARDKLAQTTQQHEQHAEESEEVRICQSQESCSVSPTGIQNDDDEQKQDRQEDDDSEDDDEDDIAETKSENKATKDEFFGVFHRLGTSWTTMLDLYRQIVGSAGGKTHKGDVVVHTFDEAMVKLKGMVNHAKATSDEKHRQQWEFRHSPLEEFDKTLDDLFRAFVHWAAADGAKDRKSNSQDGSNNHNGVYKCRGGINGRHEKINVSKAFRRLEKYASWLEAAAEQNNGEIITSPRSLQAAWKAFSMKVTIDSCDRLVWWLDLATVDLDIIHSLPSQDILGLFVWFSHFFVFADERAQENGMVFANNLAFIHFWPFMTMLPMELGIKLDEFMVSVTPLKTKLVLFFDRPRWHKFAFAMLKGFLTRNMRRRVVMVNRNAQKLVEDSLGKDCIPKGFNELDGREDVDIVGSFYAARLSSMTAKQSKNVQNDEL